MKEIGTDPAVLEIIGFVLFQEVTRLMWKQTVHGPLCPVDLGWASAGREWQWAKSGRAPATLPGPVPLLTPQYSPSRHVKACNKQTDKALESTQQGLLPAEPAAASPGVRRVHSEGEPCPFSCHLYSWLLPPGLTLPSCPEPDWSQHASLAGLFSSPPQHAVPGTPSAPSPTPPSKARPLPDPLG